MKKAVTIIITVLLLLGGAFAALWFFTDIFSFLKPARDNFAIQLGKLLNSSEKYSYSEYNAELEKLKFDGSYEVTMDVKANVNLPNDYVDYETQKNINNATFNIKSGYNDNIKTGTSKYTIFNKESKISLEAVTNDGKISIKSDDLNDKYLTFDMDKYEEFCKKNGIDYDEDTKKSVQALTNMNPVDSANFAYNMYYISEKDFKDLQKNYGDFLKKFVDKDCFSAERNQLIEVGDEEIKATGYSLTLTGEDFSEIMISLVEKIKDDDTMKKLILEKYKLEKDYLQSNQSSADSEDLPDLDEEQLEEFIDELLKELEDSKEDLSDSDRALKITIFAKNNNPVKLQIEMLEDKDDDEGTVLFVEDVEKNKNTYIIYMANISEVLDTKDESAYTKGRSSGYTQYLERSISELKIVDEYTQKGTKKNSTRNGTITISSKVSGLKNYIDVFEIEYESKKSSSEESLDLTITSPQIKGAEIDVSSTTSDIDKDSQEFSFNISGQYLLYSVQLSAKGTIDRSSDTDSTNPVNSLNSIDVYSLSKEEYDKLKEEIRTKAANSLPDKLKTFGITVTKEQILNDTKTENTTTETSVEQIVEALGENVA